MAIFIVTNNYAEKVPFIDARYTDQHAELSRVKKELAKAKMENEILKKAAIYFDNQAR